MAEKFLERLAIKFKHLPQGEFLLKASMCYKESKFRLVELSDLFPYSLKGTASNTQRKEGARLIREIIPFEYEAKKNLQKAMSNWHQSGLSRCQKSSLKIRQ